MIDVDFGKGREKEKEDRFWCFKALPFPKLAYKNSASKPAVLILSQVGGRGLSVWGSESNAEISQAGARAWMSLAIENRKFNSKPGQADGFIDEFIKYSVCGWSI